MNSLSHLLTDTLDTGVVDYLTPDNTAVTDVHQLQPLAIPVGRRRSLLTANALHGAMVGSVEAVTRLLCMHVQVAVYSQLHASAAWFPLWHAAGAGIRESEYAGSDQGFFGAFSGEKWGSTVPETEHGQEGGCGVAQDAHAGPRRGHADRPGAPEAVHIPLEPFK